MCFSASFVDDEDDRCFFFFTLRGNPRAPSVPFGLELPVDGRASMGCGLLQGNRVDDKEDSYCVAINIQGGREERQVKIHDTITDCVECYHRRVSTVLKNVSTAEEGQEASAKEIK